MNLPDGEGRPTPSAFYVEKDEGGQWCVVLETSGRVQQFRFVEEVELPEGGGPPSLDSASRDRAKQAVVRGLHLKESADANSGIVF